MYGLMAMNISMLLPPAEKDIQINEDSAALRCIYIHISTRTYIYIYTYVHTPLGTALLQAPVQDAES